MAVGEMVVGGRGRRDEGDWTARRSCGRAMRLLRLAWLVGAKAEMKVKSN